MCYAFYLFFIIAGEQIRDTVNNYKKLTSRDDNHGVSQRSQIHYSNVRAVIHDVRTMHSSNSAVIVKRKNFLELLVPL